MSPGLRPTSRARVHVVAAMLLACLTACGDDSDPVVGGADAVLSSVDLSGAVVGQKGRLRLRFTNPVKSDTTVTLVATTPAIAQVPATVTVPRGALTAEVEYEGRQLGNTLVTASTTDATVRGTVYVVDKLRITSISASAGEVGASSSITVGLNIVLPAALDLAVSSSDPSVASVDDMVRVGAFQSSGIGGIRYLAVGTSSLTASVMDHSMTRAVKVVERAQLISATSVIAVETGGPITLQVSLDAIVAADTIITTTSSNPAVLLAPALIVPTGTSSVSLPAIAGAPGVTEIIWTLNGVTKKTSVRVVLAGTLNGLNVSAPIALGQPFQLSVQLDTVAVTPHAVTLTSGDPTLVAVPSEIVVQPGDSGASVYLVPLKEGATSIVASFQGTTIQTLIIVNSAASYSTPTLSVSGPKRVQKGAYAVLDVTAYAGVYPQEFALSSSNPAVIAVQATGSANYSTSIPVTALAVGSATITVSAFGLTRTTTIEVVETAGLATLNGTTLALEEKTNLTGQLSAIAPLGTPISFTSSAPAILTVDPIVYATGSLSFSVPVTTLMSGTAIVTATMGSSSLSAVVYVGGSTSGTNLPALTGVAVGSSTVVLGASTALSGNVSNGGPTSDTPIAVAFGTPGIVTLTGAAPVIRAGYTTFSLPLTGVSAGTTTIDVTVGGITRSGSITVVAMPTFSITAPGTVSVNGQGYITVRTNAALTANATVTLSTSDGNLLALNETTGTIAPGNANAQTTFGYIAKAAGMVTLTANVGGQMLTANVTVNP